MLNNKIRYVLNQHNRFIMFTDFICNSLHDHKYDFKYFIISTILNFYFKCQINS